MIAHRWMLLAMFLLARILIDSLMSALAVSDQWCPIRWVSLISTRLVAIPAPMLPASTFRLDNIYSLFSLSLDAKILSFSISFFFYRFFIISFALLFFSLRLFSTSLFVFILS